MSDLPNSLPVSNEALAKDYFKVATVYASDFTKYRTTRKIIEKAAVNISEYFAANGSLSGLSVPGIGLKTIKILEGLLLRGLDATKSEVSDEKVSVLQHHRSRSTTKDSNDEADSYRSNSWDDAVRRNES